MSVVPDELARWRVLLAEGRALNMLSTQIGTVQKAGQSGVRKGPGGRSGPPAGHACPALGLAQGPLNDRLVHPFPASSR